MYGRTRCLLSFFPSRIARAGRSACWVLSLLTLLPNSLEELQGPDCKRKNMLYFISASFEKHPHDWERFDGTLGPQIRVTRAMPMSDATRVDHDMRSVVLAAKYMLESAHSPRSRPCQNSGSRREHLDSRGLRACRRRYTHQILGDAQYKFSLLQYCCFCGRTWAWLE